MRVFFFFNIPTYAPVLVCASVDIRGRSQSGGKGRDCAELGGPLIDPGRILACVLASLHDGDTGALKV